MAKTRLVAVAVDSSEHFEIFFMRKYVRPFHFFHVSPWNAFLPYWIPILSLLFNTLYIHFQICETEVVILHFECEHFIILHYCTSCVTWLLLVICVSFTVKKLFKDNVHRFTVAGQWCLA